MTNACASVRPAHERQGCHLDLAGAHSADHLVARHHVVQRVVERAQIRIDLFLQVARQEAEALAGFDRGAAQHDAFHPVGEQHRHRLGHRQVGLAGACRAKREHHFVACERLDIGVLPRRARPHGAAAGANCRQVGERQPGIVVGSVQHAYGRVHITGGHSLTAFEALPQACQRLLRRQHRIRVTADRHAVATARKPHPETLFQPHQVPVMVAKQ